MSTPARRRKTSKARRVASTAADFAIGGTALAAEKAVDVVDRAASTVGNVPRDVRKAVTSATRTAREAIDDRDGRAYEDRTRDELYALAADREIEGRSSMRKAELIAALRAER